MRNLLSVAQLWKRNGIRERKKNGRDHIKARRWNRARERQSERETEKKKREDERESEGERAKKRAHF